MDWIDRNKNILRACLLVGLVAAFMGPWAYDVINVPAEYACQAPNVRLYGDFCGAPLPGTWMISGAVSGLAYMGGSLLTQEFSYQEAASGLLFSLFVLLLCLPFVSTLVVMLRGERGGWRFLNIAAWGVALGLGMLIALSTLPQVYWVLWGIWLYVAVAGCAVVLEAIWLRKRAVDTG